MPRDVSVHPVLEPRPSDLTRGRQDECRVLIDRDDDLPHEQKDRERDRNQHELDIRSKPRRKTRVVMPSGHGYSKAQLSFRGSTATEKSCFLVEAMRFLASLEMTKKPKDNPSG